MSTLNNHIIFTNQDTERKYLIPATMKPKFEKWQEDFGSNGEHEEDHLAKMDKFAITSDDSMASIVAELQDLRKKLTPKKQNRKRTN